MVHLHEPDLDGKSLDLTLERQTMLAEVLALTSLHLRGISSHAPR